MRATPRRWPVAVRRICRRSFARFAPRHSEEWRLLRSLLRRRRGWLASLIAASAATGFAEAGVLALIAEAAGALVAARKTLTGSLGPIDLHLGVALALAAALVLALLRAGALLLSAWLTSRISSDALATLRGDVFDAYTQASWALQAEDSEGYVQELMTDQINQAISSLVNAGAALSAAAIFVALGITALVLSPVVAGLIIVTAIFLFGLLQPLNQLGRSSAREFSAANVDHAEIVSESVRVIEEAHVFGVEGALRHRAALLIERTRRIFARAVLTSRVALGLYQSLVLILIVGGLLALYFAGVSRLATLGAIVLMLLRASSYAQMFQGAYHAVLQSLPFLERLDTAVTRYARAVQIAGDRPMSSISALELAGVSYRYRADRPPALRNLDLVVKPGESIGVVGPTGSGKSTLTQILLRLREPNEGQYRINGTPVSAFRLSDWHKLVSYVPQEPRVVRGTVADNIKFFRQITADAVQLAARQAYIHDEIMAMPDGYDTVIGQRASAVSGGQRQRICLARALVALPQLLILDEPTSALDMVSEAGIQSSLAQLHGAVTLFIVAHRLSTLEICDRILVLDAGEVKAFGRASEVLRSNAFYRRARLLSQTPPAFDGA